MCSLIELYCDMEVTENQVKVIITVLFYGYDWNCCYYFYFVSFSSLAEKGKILGNMLQSEKYQRKEALSKLQI